MASLNLTSITPQPTGFSLNKNSYRNPIKFIPRKRHVSVTLATSSPETNSPTTSEKPEIELEFIGVLLLHAERWTLFFLTEVFLSCGMLIFYIVEMWQLNHGSDGSYPMDKAKAISREKLLRNIMLDNKIELYAAYVSCFKKMELLSDICFFFICFGLVIFFVNVLEI